MKRDLKKKKTTIYEVFKIKNPLIFSLSGYKAKNYYSISHPSLVKRFPESTW